MQCDFATDNILLFAFGIQMTLVKAEELYDGSFKTRMIPRLKHWISRNAPRQHERYRPIPQIKTRRPSKEAA